MTAAVRWIARQERGLRAIQRKLHRASPRAAGALGRLYVRCRHPSTLEAALQDAAGDDPRSQAIARQRIDVERARRRQHEGTDAFYERLENEPLNPRLLSQFTFRPELTRPTSRRALTSLSGIVARHPEAVRPHVSLGYVHTHRRQPERARLAFQRAGELLRDQLIADGRLAGDEAGGTQRPPLTFAVLGTMKAGTTSLDSWMASHPRILPTIVKEPAFYRYRDMGPEWRLAHHVPVAHPDRYVCGNNDAGTLHASESVVADMASSHPDLKLVVLHRHPVERAYSDYQMAAQREAIGQSWDDMVDDTLLVHPTPPLDPSELADKLPGPVIRSCILPHLKVWLEHFPAKQLCFIESEVLFDDPATTMRRIYSFLGLAEHSMPDHEARNVGGYAESPSERSRATLDSWFQQHEDALYSYLNRHNVHIVGPKAES